VLFVYLDAFAWRFFERHARHPLIERLRTDGLVLELRSQFPSTTAAHTTTLNSGLPVGVHGIYEWHILEPSLDRLITPLMFSFAGDGARDTLASSGLSADAVFPSETLHGRMTAGGVRSVAVMPASFADSTTNRALLRGAETLPARGVRHALELACSALADVPVYVSVYLPTFDAVMHRIGPDAPAAHAELVALLDAVHRALPRVPPGTLVLLGTDHGMAAISPERTSYVNVVWPELERHLRRGADGKALAPAGSCRDLFLHVLPGHVEEVASGLSERLADVADVVETRMLLDQDAFGSEVSDTFLARLAEVVVLPHPGEAAWWLEPGRFEQNFFGQHGGLSADEVEIPLLAFVA
jgi:Type I phosphodiesterase / nucleotide pyrophosphatase